MFLFFMCDWCFWGHWFYLRFSWCDRALWPYLFTGNLEMIYLFIFFKSIISSYKLQICFVDLPLKVEWLTISGLERENQFSVAFNLPLRDSSIMCVASNDTAFRGT